MVYHSCIKLIVNNILLCEYYYNTNIIYFYH